MNSHTPGPWRIEMRQARDDENQVAMVRGVSVVGPYCASSCGSDARLIAAAPELAMGAKRILEAFVGQTATLGQLSALATLSGALDMAGIEYLGEDE